MSVGTNVELFLEWNGDFRLQANGDVALANDVNGSTDASRQRVVRLLLSVPVSFDDAGLPVNLPTDRCNPNYGAGLPVEVGKPPDQLQASVTARGQQGLATDPTIAQVPAPIFSTSQVGITQVQIGCKCYSITGQLITIPSLPLPQRS